MSLSDPERQALLQALEEGARRAADKLARMSRIQWRAQIVPVNPGLLDRLPAVFADDVEDCSGAYLSMPGGLFVTIFPTDDVPRVLYAYLADFIDRFKGTKGVAEQLFAEMANVLVNALAAGLADACDMGFLLSSPELERGGRNGLLSKVEGKYPEVARDLAFMSHVHLYAPAKSANCSVFVMLDAPLAASMLKALEKR